MGDSQRIKTEIGINKTINVELKQNFNQIEILSLKLQQEDVYNRSCADYGVIVGRITANNGFGIPNARVSIFVPIQDLDRGNPEITTIYPYTTPQDKNEDGYRYNLLSHEKSYPDHAATGTLPTVNDVLTDRVAMEIFDKYYKYTVKTNDSGDYMIMGAPLGTHLVFLDLDLSDIGEFSLTPQDLIRMGRATEAQVAGSKFKSSNDLNSLPQIVSLTKSVDISPLWGDQSICQISITRVDFDLRDDANIDIQPTAAFIGSIISTTDKFKLRKSCKPKDNMGNLCELQTGPGRILAIRQTINYDVSGNPILEEYRLEQSGNVIDENGSWMVELPMNLDYVITNEFGEKVISPTTSLGIPTKAKYRFKIMWNQPPTLTNNVRRAYYLVPNIKEHGWLGGLDPVTNPNSITTPQLRKSYYFGLDWSGYVDINAAINCEDTFYEFQMNRVYTVAGMIDNWQKGPNRGNFIGIKEIDSPNCTTVTNKFPTNDGVRNFDLIYFIFSFLFQIIQLIGVPFLIIFHVIAYLWNNFAEPLLVALIVFLYAQAYQNFAAAAVSFPAVGLIVMHVVMGVIYLVAGVTLTIKFRDIVKKKFGRLKLAMITYPDCDACDCQTEGLEDDSSGGNTAGTTILSQYSNWGLYYEGVNKYPVVYTYPGGGIMSEDDSSIFSIGYCQSIGGNQKFASENSYKAPLSQKLVSTHTCGAYYDSEAGFYSVGTQLPLGEKINLFNRRESFFRTDHTTKIKVTFDAVNNPTTFHYDSGLFLSLSTKLDSGTMLTFVSPDKSSDPNHKVTFSTISGTTFGISGTSVQTSQVINVRYATNQTTLSSPVVYNISSGLTPTSYVAPSDIEYYQVLTAFTINELLTQFPNSTSGLLYLLTSPAATTTGVRSLVKDRYIDGSYSSHSECGWQQYPTENFELLKYFNDYKNQYITVLQRGVDPYSPIYVNKYSVGKSLVGNENALVFTANTRLNIPIQALTPGGLSVQRHTNPNEIMFPSYFFKPGATFSGFTTRNFCFYGKYDADNQLPENFSRPVTRNGVRVLQPIIYSNNDLRGSYPYQALPDISSLGFMQVTYANNPDGVNFQNYSRSFSKIIMSSSTTTIPRTNTKLVMRTDRIPSSDGFDGNPKKYNIFTAPMTPLLQQNLNFTMYIVVVENGRFFSASFGGTDGFAISADTDNLLAADVLNSFDCTNMVSLNCYSGDGINFGITAGCQGSDAIENGCYVFMQRPLKDLGKDLSSFAEWGYRFKFNFGLCRGILSEIFMNNWVNGTLYAFPFQNVTYFDKYNNPVSSDYCKDVLFFDDQTNNFYYRSSPYSRSTGFGAKFNLYESKRNSRSLLYPTTIMNLGTKSSVYSQTSLEPSAKIYTVDTLNPTSYGDTSDLLNLFVVTRITGARFLQQLFSILSRAKGLSQLFSRNKTRIDGDLAQALSINSEEGLIKFSPDFYTSDGTSGSNVQIYASATRPTMCIFYSSTTENLQFKDFLSPGVINFRLTSQPNSFDNAITYPVPIKTQEVPLYRWYLSDASIIFGSEKNDWETKVIKSSPYQGLDRRKQLQPSYFIGSNANLSDTYARGYIFHVDSNGRPALNGGTYPSEFFVGAPYHFYFGLINGGSALDKFKAKYSVVE